MKKIFIFTFMLFYGFANAEEIINCSKYSKLSKDYYNCKSNNLKKKSTNFTIKPDIGNFKDKKTIADFFKKKD
ncbi:hypothetical protein OAL81_03055 [Candidatus Pelagibacter sp.]|jgi:hypothetical protein|nr:hypothetical protein [Candidatus Pelagibacter sp.]